jgi:hypothetical protein
MPHRLVTGLLCLLLTAALAACAFDGGRSRGGTVLTATLGDGASGIGGTGHKPSGDGRGIGGTGIIGTISAFGSIWVDGVEVHYSSDQPVSIYDRSGTPSDLRVGQIVAVEAQEHSGRLVARSVEVRHAVSGPIDSIDNRAGTMTVLRQRVRLPHMDPLSESLRPGDWVSVSGLRDQSGTVVASRLDRSPASFPAFVRGDVEQVDSRGLVIGQWRFALPPGTDWSTIAPGREVILYGEPAGEGLRATRMRVGWELPFNGRVRNILVEGYLGPEGRRVGGLTLPDRFRRQAGERVVVQGRFGSNQQLEPGSLRLTPAPQWLDRSRETPGLPGPADEWPRVDPWGSDGWRTPGGVDGGPSTKGAPGDSGGAGGPRGGPGSVGGGRGRGR